MKLFQPSKLVLLVLSVTLLVSGPFLMIIDLRASELPYDFFIFSPYSLYCIIAFCTIVALIIYYLYIKDLSHGQVNRCVFYLYLSIAVFHLMIYIVNYPAIMFRDVYLHGAPTLATIEHGSIIYPTDPAPASFPLSFCYQAQFSIITGITDVRSFNLLLLAVVYLCPVLVLYCGARRINKSKSDLITSSMFTVALYPGVFFLHYARSFHALALLSVFMYMMAWPRSPKKANYAISLLLLFSIITLDPIIALFPGLAFGILALLSFFNSMKKGLLGISRAKQLVLYMTIFLTWLTFVSTTHLKMGAEQIYQTFLSGAVWEPIATTTSTQTGLNIFGVILKQSFKFSYVAIWMVGLVAMLHKRDRPSLVYSSLAFSLIPAAVILAAIDPEWDYMHKIWITLPLCVGVILPLGSRHLSQILGAPKIVRNLSHRKIKILLGIGTLFVLYILLASSITLFESNVYYDNMTHDWLNAGHKYIATYYHVGGPIAIFDLNAMYYSYWHYTMAPHIRHPTMLDYRYVIPSDHPTFLTLSTRKIITGVKSSDIAVVSDMEIYWLYLEAATKKRDLPHLFSTVFLENNVIYNSDRFIVTKNCQHQP